MGFLSFALPWPANPISVPLWSGLRVFPTRGMRESPPLTENLIILPPSYHTHTPGKIPSRRFPLPNFYPLPIFIPQQKFVFSFEKGLNGQNHVSSDSHHPIKHFPPQQNFSFCPSGGNQIPPSPINTIWKTLGLHGASCRLLSDWFEHWFYYKFSCDFLTDTKYDLFRFVLW